MPAVVNTPYSINITISDHPLRYYWENENNYSLLMDEFRDKKNNQVDQEDITELRDFEVIYTPQYVLNNIETLKRYFKKECNCFFLHT